MAKAPRVQPKLPRGPIQAGFEVDTLDLRLDQIVALKIISPGMRKSPKYLQIAASIREIGIIEPPTVFKDPKIKDKYLLLDGHMRVDILKDMGESEVTCLVSTDDEAFTYNKHVNRIATIQEHKMILRAIERGVSEQRLASALNVNISKINEKRDLLVGICPEVVEMLTDKIIGSGIFKTLRRMQPIRQVEAVTLMNDSGVYTQSYALALLAATPKSQLTHPDRPKRIKGLDEEKMARMEAEMESLQREFRLIDDNYARDVMNLTFAKGYLGTLLGNAKVVRYLAAHHPDVLVEFQKITELHSLGAGLA